MATERGTRHRRRMLVGVVVMTTGLAAVLGIVALRAGGEGRTPRADASRPATATSETVRSAPGRAATTTTGAPSAVDTSTTSGAPRAVGTSTTTEAPIAVDTSTVSATGADPEPAVGSTQECRKDPTCPSSEHRTSDACGATVIVDQGGYLEGRHDAEQGRPYQIDGAPAPGPADDDDDDATVGPQTAYRAGYVQGWCDGGGDQPGSP